MVDSAKPHWNSRGDRSGKGCQNYNVPRVSSCLEADILGSAWGVEWEAQSSLELKGSSLLER